MREFRYLISERPIVVVSHSLKKEMHKLEQSIFLLIQVIQTFMLIKSILCDEKKSTKNCQNAFETVSLRIYNDKIP